MDPRIAGALKEISAASIQANIERLVSFGTRSTLSAQDRASIAAGHGIGYIVRFADSSGHRVVAVSDWITP